MPLPPPLAPPAFTLVVAADDRGGLGRDGALPWHLPGDLRRFRTLTTGAGRNAVIMGRVTWETLPPSARPLPGRRNIVMSRDPHFGAPGAVCTATSLDHALTLAADCDALFVVGGGHIFALALDDPRCHAVELTRIDGDFDCDTFLRFPRPAFARASASERHVHGGVGYTFERWVRRASEAP